MHSSGHDRSGRRSRCGGAGGTWGPGVNDVTIVRPLRLTLLGGFTLATDTDEIVLPMSAQRLVAVLALRERPLSRAHLAGLLWPDCPTERSLADLRTALWRANHTGVEVIAVTGMRLCI